MGWCRAGAQQLLHVKTAIINGRLDRIPGIIQHGRISPDPQVFAGLHLTAIDSRGHVVCQQQLIAAHGTQENPSCASRHGDDVRSLRVTPELDPTKIHDLAGQMPNELRIVGDGRDYRVPARSSATVAPPTKIVAE
jgi:hypothetical protein